MSNKQEQEDLRPIQMAGYSAVMTLAFAALIFVFFFSLDGASIARISQLFFIEIDLEKCQLNFSRLLMTQTAFSVAVGIALLLILLLAIADIYTFKRKPGLYGKLLLVLALFP